MPETTFVFRCLGHRCAFFRALPRVPSAKTASITVVILAVIAFGTLVEAQKSAPRPPSQPPPTPTPYRYVPPPGAPPPAPYVYRPAKVGDDGPPPPPSPPPPPPPAATPTAPAFAAGSACSAASALSAAACGQGSECGTQACEAMLRQLPEVCADSPGMLGAAAAAAWPNPAALQGCVQALGPEPASGTAPFGLQIPPSMFATADISALHSASEAYWPVITIVLDGGQSDWSNLRGSSDKNRDWDAHVSVSDAASMGASLGGGALSVAGTVGLRGQSTNNPRSCPRRGLSVKLEDKITGPGPPGRLSTLAFPTVNRFSMALLCERAGRLSPKTAVSGAGSGRQAPEEVRTGRDVPGQSRLERARSQDWISARPYSPVSQRFPTTAAPCPAITCWGRSEPRAAVGPWLRAHGLGDAHHSGV
jgi:hypothetical protein